MDLRLSNFFYLAFAAAVGAMLLLSTATQNSIRTAGQVIFYPITKPLRLAVTAPTPASTVATPKPQDEAQLRAILDQNAALLNQNAIYAAQLEIVRQRDAQAEMLGQELSAISTRARVISADSSKTLQLARVPNATIGAPVVLPQRLIGRISNVGIGGQGATVQLITHANFKCIAKFGRQIDNGPGKAPTFGYLQLSDVVVQGMPDETPGMRIDTLKLDQVRAAGLQKDDVLVLRDPDPAWGTAVQNIRLGVVTSIEARAGAPGLAEIRIRPEIDLLGLREVLVARTR